MSKELTTEINPEIVNSLVLTGDMSKLSPTQQTQYYTAVCKSVGINPITQPFAIINFQGKKILYATKGCSQQLADTRSISTEVKDRKTVDSVYIVSIRATMKDGRYTDEDGIVSVSGLKGVELANAMMKAVTKAKRRAVLALCGLGMPDETEIEDTPHAVAQPDNGKSRIENIVEEAEIVHPVKSEPTPTPAPNPVPTPKPTLKPTPTPADPVAESESYLETKLETVELKEGEKLAQGIITLPPQTAQVAGPDGKPAMKFNFTMSDQKYGTFDKSVFEGICAVIDEQTKKKSNIILNIVYKDRAGKDKVFHDIVRFSVASINSKPMPI